MDTSNFRPDLHVAQQSRRDKLRNHLNPYNNNIHHDLPYDPPAFCSDYPDPPDPNFGTWQNIPSQNTTNNTWVSVIRDNNNNTYQNPTFVGDGISSVNPSMLEVKPYNTNELYHNTLQDLVKGPDGTGPGPWAGGGGELLLLPAYADQIGSSSRRPPETRHWNGEALSLSLSSVPLAERSHHDVIERAPGPLGPFTGYSTILRSSRFLRPAQVLLEELCCVARPKHLEINYCDKMIEEVRVSGGGDLSCSSFSIGVNGGREVEGASGWLDSCRPESLHKKAKLLYMQEEVSKKYKQYQQQMQMVVSSFESVEGLGTSTPYVSLALKMVSKHFRCLKTAITDQLKIIRNALGEELASPSTSRGDSRASMLKFFDQSSQKQKVTNNDNNNAGNIDGQPIWRPQRGLPERAVSILRAWLFDHFLHPYPTDTDKHMLATQTGLTRNQVSNWFINARVRLWKPMVEEIHMLETKAMDETCSDGKTTTNTNNAGQCSNTVQTSGKYSSVDYPISASWNQEKRSRIEYGNVQTGVINDGSLMGLVPAAHHQSVSLTLGLRQSAENGQRPQHYGGQFRRDFA